ncbi:MAG: site-specific integrase, partial [Planctomycetota bacterium]
MAPANELLERYLQYCAAECGLSTNTISAYRADVADFLDFLPARRRAGLESVSSARLVEY